MNNSVKIIPFSDDHYIPQDWEEWYVYGIDQPFKIVFADIGMKFLEAIEIYKNIKEHNPAAVVVMRVSEAIEELLRQEFTGDICVTVLEPVPIKRYIDLLSGEEMGRSGSLILAIGGNEWFTASLQNVLNSKTFALDSAYSGKDTNTINNRWSYRSLRGYTC